MRDIFGWRRCRNQSTKYVLNVENVFVSTKEKRKLIYDEETKTTICRCRSCATAFSTNFFAVVAIVVETTWLGGARTQLKLHCANADDVN